MNNFNPIKHIAFIPDGNRRWAKAHNLPTFEGHRRGFKRIMKLGEKIRKLNIQIFTVWAFSTENWKRDEKEVNYLMQIYTKWVSDYLKKAIKDHIRIVHLGRKDRIPPALKKSLSTAEEKTKHFDEYFLVVALDYGGRDEIIRAVKKIQNSKFRIQNLDEKTFKDFLDTKDLPYPNPDLVIRTSGEQRSSGFLTWQTAYAEYIFHEKYLPDFTVKDLEQCIKEYQRRQRRFGK